MNGRSDQELVREYAERRSETAFAELVRRHIDLVHSAALRMVRDSHLAEDVTQSVFVAFGQNARQLSDRDVLSGWLHRTTQNLAAKLVRTEMRRRAREQEAVAMNQHPSDQSEPAWEQVAPHLDAALGELAEADRDALLLRYFQRKPAREMAGVLGLSEEAAQKRVTRALEKLRGVFAARGVAVSTTALAGLLALQAVQTAPAALAATVATASLAAGTASTFTLLSLMASTKLKLGLAAVVAAGLVTPLVIQQQQLKQLRGDNAALLEQTRELDSLRADNARLAKSLTDTDELSRSRQEHLDLLRLRGEVTRLGNELRRSQASQPKSGGTNTTASEAAVGGQNSSLPYTKVFTARVRDGGTIATGGWRASEGKRGFLLVTPLLVDTAGNPLNSDEDRTRPGARTQTFGDNQLVQVHIKTEIIELPESDLSSAILQRINDETTESAPVLSEDSAELKDLLALAHAPGTSSVVSSPQVSTLSGRQARVFVGAQEQVSIIDGTDPPRYRSVGTTVDLLPRMTTDGRSIDVEAAISFDPPDATPGIAAPPSDANLLRRLPGSR